MDTRRMAQARGWAGLLTVAGVLALAGPAFAQIPQPIPEDLADRARIRFGPVYLQPWVSITNAGLDTNIFNDTSEPKEDYTATVTPGLEGGVRARAARLGFRTVADYVWYQTYKSEQGVDASARLQFELRYTWLRPHVSGDWLHTRSRVDYEIDARAERRLPTYEAGVDARIASRTWIVLDYRLGQTQYLAGEIYNGVPLDQALNHKTDTVDAGIRLELSPLTTVSLAGQFEQVRFDTSAVRNNDSRAFTGTFDFSPQALLSGRAMVGYKRLQASTPTVPDYSGPVASVGLRYSPVPSTSFGFDVDRDIVYSFEDSYAYFLQDGMHLSLTQRLVGSFEVTVQGRREWLDYRGTIESAPPRTDVVTSYGGGAGYRFADLARLGVDVERVERTSALADRGYVGTRIYGSFRYGF